MVSIARAPSSSRRAAPILRAMDALVSTDWLGRPSRRARTSRSSIPAVFMPSSGRDGRAEFLDAHIPGARFLDIDEVSDRSQPGAAHAAVGRRSSARRWRRSASAATTASSSMTIRRCGPRRAAGSCCATSARRNVAILDGGLQKWVAEGRPVESGEPAPRAGQLRGVRSRRRGGDQGGRARRRRPDARRPRQAALRRQRARPAPGRRRRPYPGRAQPAVRALYNDDGTFRSRDELRAAVRRSRASIRERRSSPAAARASPPIR